MFKIFSKITILTGLFVLTFSAGLAVKSYAEDAPKTLFGDYLKEHDIEITGSATMDFYDKYVWRGQYLDHDAVIQPGVSFTAKGLTVGYWANMPLENSDALKSDESDYYLSYTYTYEKVSLTAGHTWYQFPGTSTSSREFSVGVAVDTFLSPSVTYYHDYEDGKDLNTLGHGNYWAVSASKSIPLVPKYNINANLAATFGYIDGQWLSGRGEHFTPTLGLSLPLTANLTIVPTIGYNITMGDLNKSSIGNQDSKFFGGVHSTFAF